MEQLHRDGQPYWVALDLQPLPDESGAITSYVGLQIDITERVRAQEALRQSEERFRDLYDNASDIVYTIDLAGTFTSINRRAEGVLSYTVSEIVGMNIATIVAPECLEQAHLMIEHKVRLGDPEVETMYELDVIGKDGRRRTFEINSRLMCEHGQPVGIQGIARDVSERKRLEHRLIHDASHDSLTTLPNRAFLVEHLSAALYDARADGGTVAILFIDLDNFKLVNDSLGHEAGDRLLVAASRRLQRCVRPDDIVARLGGDEFTVLITSVSGPDDAERVANRITDAFHNPFELGGREVYVGASIGIALSDPASASADDLLRDADAAMYAAKVAGKGRHVFFAPDMTARAMRRLALETDLRQAIGRGELHLVYQPLVRLQDGHVDGVEALIRWSHPERGLISPPEIVPLAEETGLIVPLGRWVLQEACRQVRAWQTDLPDSQSLTLSVNLSAYQFRDPDLLADVVRALETTGLPPTSLTLEITDSLMMEDSTTVLDVLSELEALGIQLAVDDFGVGNSALSTLKRFPVDVLKIDRCFIDGLGRDRQGTAIVHAVLAIARALDLEVTAVGIETAEQLAVLRELGCQRGQGFYLAEPQTAEALGALLSSEPELTLAAPVGMLCPVLV